MVDVVLVSVLDDGGLGELTIVGALILMSGLTRLATLCEVCFMVLFYIANFMLIVDFHPRWLCRDFSRRILLLLPNLCQGIHPWWRCTDLWCYCNFRGMLKEFGHFGVDV